MSVSLLDPLEPHERLSADDLATRQEAEHLQAALAEHRRRVQRQIGVPRGVCASCGAQCLPQAVYCDADCRDDHERLIAARRRAGQPLRGDV